MIAGRDLAAEILAEEARFDELTRRRDDSSRRLADLRAARDRTGQAETAAGAVPSSDSWPRERKLRLFEGLFRGRPDVFPKRWKSESKSGWAPCCANEWEPGVCENPRVRCGECPNQAFAAPTEHELRAHLEGHQVEPERLDGVVAEGETSHAVGGRTLTARYKTIALRLHPHDGEIHEYREWEARVGFIESWHSYSFVLLGSVGVLDRFTVTASRFAQAIAVEDRDAFDERFGVVEAH